MSEAGAVNDWFVPTSRVFMNEIPIGLLRNGGWDQCQQ